jgi:dihydrofolate reductase
MPIFYAIAAMSENRVIGSQGKLPWNLPEDYRWFKHKTMGGTLIMGRKTYESIGEPLPGRETVVLTRSSKPLKVSTCPDISSLDQTLPPLPKPYWVCGGVEIYRQLLKNCDLLYITQVKRIVAGDAFFPPFEDKFELDQTIHENELFRVERWKRLFHSERAPIEPEPWPFTEPTG